VPVLLRTVMEADAEHVASLLAELGYPSNEADIRNRLRHAAGNAAPAIMGGDFRLRKKYSLRRFRFSFQLFILPSWPRKAKRRTIVNVPPYVALLLEADVRWPAGAR
jgi:hypothetical protein